MSHATSAPGWPVLRGIQTVKEVAYLNMREAAAAAALAKLWSDTFLTNAGIYAAGSANYTYQGTPNFNVILNSAPVQFANNMTAANLPEPFVASASGTTGEHYPWNAFDGDDAGTYWQSNNLYDTLTLDCGAGKRRVTTYKVLGYGATNAPKDWTFEGSDTGAFAGEQTVLDTRTNQDTSTKKTYTVASPASFRYYRINTTAINASTSTVIRALDLFEAGATTATIVSVRALDLAANITQAIMFADVTLGTGTAAYYISTDDGSTWTAVTPETLASVPSGKKIRIKVELTGDAALNSWGVAA